MKKYFILILLVFISGCMDTVEYKEPVELEKQVKTFVMGQDALIDGVLYKVSGVETYSEIGESEVSQKTEGVCCIPSC